MDQSTSIGDADEFADLRRGQIEVTIPRLVKRVSHTIVEHSMRTYKLLPFRFPDNFRRNTLELS